jgi:serine phosphatase RsbU (regulator of sigma subunit)
VDLHGTAPDPESGTPRFHAAETNDLPPVSPDPDNVTGQDAVFPSGLSALLTDRLSDAIIVIDRVGHIVYSNPASAIVLGWGPPDLVGRPLVEIIPDGLPSIGHTARLPARRPDGSEALVEISLAAWTPGNATPGTPTPATPDTERLGTATPGTATPGTATPGTATPATPDGATPDTATPAPGTATPDGATPDGAIVVLRRAAEGPCKAGGDDGLVARLGLELEQSRRSREFLLRASRVLAEARNLQETLERLATMAVPILGDLCLIDMLVEGGSLKRVVARHASPEWQPLADQLRDHFPPDPQGGHPSVQVIRTGTSMWSSDMSTDFLRRTTRDEDHLALVSELAFTSYMSVPLIASGRVLGSVTLVAAGSGRHFGESDLALAEELAQQVAAVIDRARVYDREHEVARTLQGSLLPDRLPEVPGITVAARYLPSSEGAQVGGDWYDVIPVAPGCVGLVVGDVVGHDLTAVTVMGQLRNALRAYALLDPDPALLLRQMGGFTERLGLERTATVLFGLLELPAGTLTLASAGHPPPLVIPATAAPWFVDLDPGPLLGLAPLNYPLRQVVLGPGDVVVFYTDGLVEDRETGVGPGMDWLLGTAAGAPRSAELVCEALMQTRLAGAPRCDDVAILAVQRS